MRKHERYPKRLWSRMALRRSRTLKCSVRETCNRGKKDPGEGGHKRQRESGGALDLFYIYKFRQPFESEPTESRPSRCFSSLTARIKWITKDELCVGWTYNVSSKDLT